MLRTILSQFESFIIFLALFWLIAATATEITWLEHMIAIIASEWVYNTNVFQIKCQRLKYLRPTNRKNTQRTETFSQNANQTQKKTKCQLNGSVCLRFPNLFIFNWQQVVPWWNIHLLFVYKTIVCSTRL